MVADPAEGDDPDQERPDLAGENDGDGGDLTPTQEQAIIALLNEQTLGRAAAAAKVGQRTLLTPSETLGRIPSMGTLFLGLRPQPLEKFAFYNHSTW